MEEKNYDACYCVFCETTETLKEFKAVYICETCIEIAKGLEPASNLEETD